MKLLEREKLARELHDTVAHHVSAIAIRAQAGRVVASTDPAAAVEALTVIEQEASRTLAEMRTMVGALRQGEAPDLTPQRGVAQVEDLATSPGERPRVDVELSGDLDGLRPSVEPPSSASPRSRSPTPCATPATPPASRWRCGASPTVCA